MHHTPPPLPAQGPQPAPRRKARWWLAAGLVLAGCASALLAAFIYLYFPWRPGLAEHLVQIDSLRVGDCFAERPEDLEADYVDYVLKQSCHSAYKRKIYASTTLRGAKRNFPGEDLLDEVAADYCLGMFYPTQGVLYEDSAYDFGYYIPSASSWRAGDYEILCYLYREEDNGAAPFTPDTVRISL